VYAQRGDIDDTDRKHIATPGRIVSARELLGEMRFEPKRRADALRLPTPSVRGDDA
jgi:hypothetical protein